MGKCGLVIDGEPGSELKVVVEAGFPGGVGILCANDFTSTNLDQWYDLTFQGGVNVSVSNKGANKNSSGDPAYPAIAAKEMIFDHSDVSAFTTSGSGVEALYHKFSPICKSASLWYYDEDDKWQINVHSYTYEYDVKVNGYRFTDKKLTMDQSDMTNISCGSAEYDPDKNVLVLKSGFTMEVRDGYSCGIEYNGSKPLTIKLDSYSKVLIAETSSKYNKGALRVNGPVTLDLSGCNMELSSQNGNGIDLDSQLTIQNTWGVYGEPNEAERKTLTAKGGSFGIIGTSSEALMTMDHVNVEAKGGIGSVHKIETLLNGVEINSIYRWNSDNTVIDNYDQEVKAYVNFKLSEWKLATQVWPEGAGKVQIVADEKTYDNEYYFKENTTAVLYPVANEGWEFYGWAEGNDYNPLSVNLTVGHGSDEYEAQFVHQIESETTWFTLVNDGGTYSLYPLTDKLRTQGDKIADLTLAGDHGIICSAYAEGYLYYIECNSIGTKSWLARASFDGKTLGSPEVLTPDEKAEEYSFFYSMAYSGRDKCFYAVCQRMSDAQREMIRISMDGTITDLVEMSDGYFLDGMVVDEDGKLYTIYNGKDMFVMDPKSDYSAHIGELGLTLPGSSSTALFYDDVTKEMFVFGDDVFWRIDKTTGEVVPVWVKTGFQTNSIFCLPQPKGIDNVQRDNVPCTKVIENGVLYLMRNGIKYDARGQVIIDN